MKYIKLFESWSEDSNDWRSKYLDDKGHYKGVESEYWKPSESELANLVQSLESMGFKIESKEPYADNGDLFIIATCNVGDLTYKIDLVGTKHRTNKTGAPETEKMKYSNSPFGATTAEEPHLSLRRFKSGEIPYSEYAEIAKSHGKSEEEYDKYAFGQGTLGSFIKFPGYELTLQEEFFDQYGDQIHDDQAVFMHDLSNANGDLVVEGSISVGGGEVTPEIFSHLPELIGYRLEELAEGYEAPEYDEEGNPIEEF
jgi:hypothetical protein